MRKLTVQFQRKAETVTVVGTRLDPFLASLVADFARAARKARRRTPQGLLPGTSNETQAAEALVVRGRGGVFKFRAAPVTAALELVSDPTRRQPRNGALWLWVCGGSPPSSLPTLKEIAALREADWARWGEFIGRFGLLENGQRWILPTPFAVEFTDPPIAKYLMRVPIGALHRIAKKAAILLDAERVALRLQSTFKESHVELDFLFESLVRKHFPPTLRSAGAEESRQWARQMIASELEDALKQMEAGWSVEFSGRGIPGDWALNARGCWPLVVLKRFVHKRFDVSTSVKCAAPDCPEMVPWARLRGRWVGGREGAHYCSVQCQRREKKRRQRAGKKLLPT